MSAMCQQQITSTYKAMASAPNMAAWCHQCIMSMEFSVIYCQVLGRTMWTHVSFWQELVLPGICILNLDTYFNLSPSYHVYVSFFKISYQGRFCLQISYPAILFTMLKGFLNCRSFIVHILLLGTKRSHCQFSCRAHTFTSFCQAHNNTTFTPSANAIKKKELPNPNPNPWSLLQLQSYPFSITASLPRQMSNQQILTYD